MAYVSDQSVPPAFEFSAVKELPLACDETLFYAPSAHQWLDAILASPPTQCGNPLIFGHDLASAVLKVSEGAGDTMSSCNRKATFRTMQLLLLQQDALMLQRKNT